jgi:hypothetical protein
VLYCFLWGPGLIANLLFYREARQAERDYGQSLPGVGLLRGLLVLQVIGVAFFMIVAVLVTAAIVGG